MVGQRSVTPRGVQTISLRRDPGVARRAPPLATLFCPSGAGSRMFSLSLEISRIVSDTGPLEEFLEFIYGHLSMMLLLAIDVPRDCFQRGGIYSESRITHLP